ncbi:MAG: hypothetical protein SGJ02_14390, partial [bacterium]|nr:hypothetical protein [bacterium]
INLSPIGQNLLTKLSGNILTKIETSQWPGTQLLESKATAFTFRADNFSKEVLKSATSGLFSWVQPELPEDLCFSYDDGSELMTTVTHEKIAYLHLNDNDKNLILKNCPQIFK